MGDEGMTKNILAAVGDAMSRVKAELDGIRSKIRDLVDELDVLQAAPVAAEEAIERLDVKIRGEALRFEHGRASLGAMVHERYDLEAVFGSSLVPGGGGGVPCLTIGALCWLAPDLVRERLRTELRRQWDGNPPGLPAKERRAHAAEIKRRIRELERQEETLIVEAESIGLPLDRRGDVSAEVFLEASDDVRARG